MKKLIITAVSLAALAAGLSSCAKSTAPQPENWALLGFERPVETPVLSPDSTVKFYCPMRQDSVAWMESDVFNPAAVLNGDSIVVLFRSEDNSATGIGKRTSRIGYATSADGVTFDISPMPVLYPADDSQKEMEWPGGCEDPRVAKTPEGKYVMMYTQWNRQVPRLAVATSTDLRNWTKHGPAFAKAHNGRFADIASKSASIVNEIDPQTGELLITKINGKYLMYWGEQFVNVAVSDNLTDWTPLLDENGELLRVMETRDGYFDSDLTECGPPAIITPNGIVLLYNGKNSGDERRDKRYTAKTYSAGQALFSADDPTKLITRLDEPFFKPEAAFEKSGQYPDGTVFIEGLVHRDGKWYLYYGCADSRVGMAVLYDDPSKNPKAGK